MYVGIGFGQVDADPSRSGDSDQFLCFLIGILANLAIGLRFIIKKLMIEAFFHTSSFGRYHSKAKYLCR